MRNRKRYIVTFTRNTVIKLYMFLTYCKELPPIKPQDSFFSWLHEVTPQIKSLISILYFVITLDKKIV